MREKEKKRVWGSEGGCLGRQRMRKGIGERESGLHRITREGHTPL